MRRSSTCSSGPDANVAAACTKTSHRLCRSRTSLAARRTSSGPPRSTATSPARSRTTTVWSDASRATIAPPMAPAPPVTTATRSGPLMSAPHPAWRGLRRGRRAAHSGLAGRGRRRALRFVRRRRHRPPSTGRSRRRGPGARSSPPKPGTPPPAFVYNQALAVGFSRGFVVAAGSRCSPCSSASPPSGSAARTWPVPCPSRKRRHRSPGLWREMRTKPPSPRRSVLAGSASRHCFPCLRAARWSESCLRRFR
jgi:hypothetical protein